MEAHLSPTGRTVVGNSSRHASLFALLVFAASAELPRSVAESVLVSWTPPLGSDVAGYRLFYAAVGSPVLSVIDCGPRPNARIDGLHSGRTYEFRVHSYNNLGLEGDASPSHFHTALGVDSAPVATPEKLGVMEGTTQDLVLQATDEDGDPLTFELLSLPSFGVLRGTPPNLTYVPPEGFLGIDSFRFRVTDGVYDSEAEIECILVPQQGRSEVLMASVLEDSPATFQVPGPNPSTEPSSFHLTVPPKAGSVEGQPPSLLYRPLADFWGADWFSLTSTNPGAEILHVVCQVTVLPVNDPPVAETFRQRVESGASVAFELVARDVDSLGLIYRILLQPTHGRLSGEPPSLVYSPRAGFTGTDAFAYYATDGQASSAPASVVLEVTAKSIPREADAGPDQTITLPGEAVLRGTVINDSANDPLDPLVLQWFQTDGPDLATILNPFDLSTKVEFQTPGSYTFEFQVYHKDQISTDSVRLEVGTLTPLPAGIQPFTLYLEAESGVIDPPMTTLEESHNSPSQTTWVTSSNAFSGAVSLPFTVPRDGDYLVWCRVLTPGPLNDAVSVSIDDPSSEDIADFNEGYHQDGWRWMLLPGRGGKSQDASYAGVLTPRVFNLTAGAHTLNFHTYDALVGLDKLVVTQDPQFDPRLVESSTHRPTLLVNPLPDGRIELTWDALIGRRYQILTRTSLADPDWAPLLQPVRADSTELRQVLPFDVSTNAAFYSVLSLP